MLAKFCRLFSQMEEADLKTLLFMAQKMAHRILQQDFEQVLHRPIETAPFIRNWSPGISAQLMSPPSNDVLCLSYPPLMLVNGPSIERINRPTIWVISK